MKIMVPTERIPLVFPLHLFVGSTQINHGNRVMFNCQKNPAEVGKQSQVTLFFLIGTIFCTANCSPSDLCT